LNRPGGNITGFLFSEAGIGGKWVELLKEIAPDLKQVAMLFNPETAPGRGSHYLASFQDAARSLKVKALTAPVRSDAEIESSIASLGRELDSGFVAIGDSFLVSHRKPIILAAARYKTPAVFSRFLRQRRRVVLVRTRQCGYISSGSRICRSYPPWRKPRRVARSGADQI
jgi:ABC-type uncharacterized transport system substrate-binding protein